MVDFCYFCKSMSEFDEYIRQATQEMIAKHLHRSERTVKSMTVRLTEKEYLARKNGKRDGWWEVLVDLPTL